MSGNEYKSGGRPSFWLQVRKEYIIDNIDGIITYLSHYSYDKQLDNSDYDQTLECMAELCRDYAAMVGRCPIWDVPDIGIGRPLALRLFGATILGYAGKGETPAALICDLAEIVASFKITSNAEDYKRLWRIVVGVACDAKIEKTGFGWPDINVDNFKEGIFAHKFSLMRLSGVKADTRFFYEGRGAFLFDRAEGAAVAPFNIDKYAKTQTQPKLRLDGVMGFEAAADDRDKVSTIKELCAYIYRQAAMMGQVTKSPKRELKEYAEGDRLLVRVTGKDSWVYARSIDGNYREVEGRVRLTAANVARPDLMTVRDFLRVDDVIEVVMSGDSFVRFDMSEPFEEFYRAQAEKLCQSTFDVIFDTSYEEGSVWLTDSGIRINIFDKYMTRACDDAMDDNVPLRVLAYVRSNINASGRFMLYARPQEAIYHEQTWTRKEADENLLDDFLDYCDNLIGERRIALTKSNFQAMGLGDMRALVRIAERMAQCSHLSSYNYMLMLGMAYLLATIAGMEQACDYLRHEMDYHLRCVEFARNERVEPMPLNDRLSDAADYQTHIDVVEMLASYKPSADVAPLTHGSTDSVKQRIEALIDASNSLINIIDAQEAENIKHEIVRSLDVEDEFVPKEDSRTFYGTENIKLEFKLSAVFPPVNRRVQSGKVADPERQGWAILKAVCGFLNSRSGGEVLIGVNDSGYASGVAEDMRELAKLGKIDSPDVDHYRLYLQKLVDYAFRERGGDNRHADIVAMNVAYTPETTPDGKTIMRISVKPYLQGIVEFDTESRALPSDYVKAYVRGSGRTMPLLDSAVKEVEKYKAEAMKDATSSMGAVGEAMRRSQVVRLVNYCSSSGTADRLVEVYQRWSSPEMVYGYDRERKAPRLFKLSRCERVEVTDQKWSGFKCAREIELDPWGMKVDKKNFEETSLFLTDYGRILLIEEFPDSAKLISRNDGRDSREWPWLLKCRVSSADGAARFCAGLPAHVRVAQGQKLQQALEGVRSLM